MCVLLNGLIHKISILSIYVLKETSNKIIYMLYMLRINVNIKNIL